MPKKLDFKKIIKKIEVLSSKVNIIMRNKLIIALFLIIDGITFILNPDTTLPEMARNIILIMLLASISVLITNLAAKTKDKKTIIISTAITIMGIVFYIYPDIISAYIQLLLSLFIIYDGATNIANALNLDIMSNLTQAITKKYNKITNRKAANQEKQERRNKFKVVDDNINEGLEQQKEKLITPLRNIVNKTNKSSILYTIISASTIIFGIVLLIFPDVSMTIWGIIFLYTGSSNLFASVRTMDLLKKIKEKKFKEIIFDTNKDSKQKSQTKMNKK